MRLPSKVTPYERSILSKFPPVLIELRKADLPVCALYSKVHRQFDDISDFIDVIDCLYILGKIELLVPEEVLHYVG